MRMSTFATCSHKTNQKAALVLITMLALEQASFLVPKFYCAIRFLLTLLSAAYLWPLQHRQSHVGNEGWKTLHHWCRRVAAFYLALS